VCGVIWSTRQTQSVKKPTGFSGMNVSNMVGSKRTVSIKMLKMHFILFVQISLSVQNRWLVYARMWAERGSPISASVRTTSQFTGRSGQTVCSPHLLKVTLGPFKNWNMSLRDEEFGKSWRSAEGDIRPAGCSTNVCSYYGITYLGVCLYLEGDPLIMM